jgi:peptide/nickel transport system substrate-binding protein
VKAGPLLAAAALALLVSAAAARPAGDALLVVDEPSVFSIDPASAYLPGMGPLLAATSLKLVNYPDAPGAKGERPVAEASEYPEVSANRLTWTFTLKTGLRFSDGTPVDPADAAFSIARQIWDNSPGGNLLSAVVGYKQLESHKQQTAPGIAVVGNSVVIRLTQPDNGLPLQLASNYFAILPSETGYGPISEPVPTAGPYQVESYSYVNQIVLRSNPFYTGPRPSGPDTIVLRQRTPADAVADARSGAAEIVLDNGLTQSSLAGFHKTGTLRVNPAVETDYVALNTSRPLFRTARMRQAFNFALDRPAMLRQRGAFAGRPTDQILPPGMIGFRDAKIYPVEGANVPKARGLAGAHCSLTRRCHGNLVTCNRPDCVRLAKVVKLDLARIGVDLRVRALDGARLFDAAHDRKAFDAVFWWRSPDYEDPSDFVDVLLDHSQLGRAANTNLSFLNDPAVNRKRAAARNLLGPARYKAYGSLDIDITAHAAPWASFDNRNVREFVSKHVKNYVFQPVYGGANLAALQVR